MSLVTQAKKDEENLKQQVRTLFGGLNVASVALEESAGRKEKVAYSLGSFASAVSYQSFTAFMLYFYVDVLKLPVLLASIGMGIYGLWNALNDPLAGHISDRTRTRWGRRIPYVALGSLPLAIAYAFVWTPPLEDGAANPLGLFIYFVLIINVFDTLYTFVILNWTALFPEMYPGLSERAEVSSYRQQLGVIGLIAGVAAPPIIYGSLGWGWLGLLIGAMTLATLYVSVLGSRERKEYSLEKPLPFKDSFKATFSNKSFLLYVIPYLFVQFTFVILTAVAPFYTKYVLGFDETQTALFLLTAFLAALPSVLLWRVVTVRKGTKRAFAYCMGAFSLTLIAPLVAFDFPTGVIAALLIGLGLGGPLVIPDILLAEVIDEDELDTGRRREGTYFGMNAFFIRLAIVLEALAVGTVLDYSGYVPGLIPQPETAILGMRLLMSIIPILALIIAFMAFSRYPLFGEKLARVRMKVEEIHKEKRAKLPGSKGAVLSHKP